LLEKTANGEIDILIGTHALIAPSRKKPKKKSLKSPLTAKIILKI